MKLTKINNKDFQETSPIEFPVKKRPLSDDFRSQEVQEIISERPGFWGTWALPAFLVILLLIVGGTWFIRYPDTIKATALLEANNGPRAIVTRQEGKLIKLFTHNGDTLNRGDDIGWMESTGDHQQIQKLSRYLDSALLLLQNNRAEDISSLSFRFHHLGELQPDYQVFITALQQFTDYLSDGYYHTKKHILLKDIAFLKMNNTALNRQWIWAQKDIALANSDFQTNEKLHREKVISDLDYRKAQSVFLNKQQGLSQLELTLTNNLQQQTDKQSEITELEHTISKQKEIFTQSLHTLKSKVDQWISQYVMKAPVAGTVAFLLPLQENSFLRANETLGYVNPLNSTYYASVHFSQQNFGKATVGQAVQLRLNAYPYEQFGILKGRLSYISKVASDSGFLGRVELPDGLETEYHHTIQFRSGLNANAIIILKPMRLLQRFYYNMLKKVNK